MSRYVSIHFEKYKNNLLLSQLNENENARMSENESENGIQLNN